MAGSRSRALTIVSLGGNAVIRRGQSGTIEEQFDNARAAAALVARLAGQGVPVAVTHGNGPVVGNIVIRNNAAKGSIPQMPLYICGADSQGGVGFMFQQAIHNSLREEGSDKDVVALVTQVVVDLADPAFKAPSKPIGPYYSSEEAGSLAREQGWTMKEDGQGGFRRVVPSPRPLRIVEAEVIKGLVRQGVIVIAAGGGGVPVAQGPDGRLTGVDAVIDKDSTSALLGSVAGAERFIDLTQVDMAYLDYGQPGQRGIPRMSAAEARRRLDQGHFAPGSMGPKIEAALEFLGSGGKEVIITTPELAAEALEGRAGTRIYP